VYIHGSIHIIHILIHRKSPFIARFLVVFHTLPLEYGTRIVDRNCKNETSGTHRICKYGVTVSGDFCSYRNQNYVVTSEFDRYFTKNPTFFCMLSPPDRRRNPARNARKIVAMLRERRLIIFLLKKTRGCPRVLLLYVSIA